MRIAQGVRTNMASYRAVMYAYARAGDWASALGLLEDARREELQPSTGDLRTLVQVIRDLPYQKKSVTYPLPVLYIIWIYTCVFLEKYDRNAASVCISSIPNPEAPR